jgi:hypothetical protein
VIKGMITKEDAEEIARQIWSSMHIKIFNMGYLFSSIKDRNNSIALILDQITQRLKED